MLKYSSGRDFLNLIKSQLKKKNTTLEEILGEIPFKSAIAQSNISHENYLQKLLPFPMPNIIKSFKNCKHLVTGRKKRKK